MKLPAIDLQATLGKVPGLSKFIKPKAAGVGSGSAKAKAAAAKSHEQQVQQRLDLTMKGLGALALLLVLFALYTVFAQNGLMKTLHNAAPPMVDLSELAPAAGGKSGAAKGDAAKDAQAANTAKVKLPEGTDPRIDYAFEQIANFENTRSEALLRSANATVAGVAPGSVAARAGFRVGDLILSVDGEQAGFVWDTMRKLTAAGKSSVLLEVQRGNEVLRGELAAPEGALLTSSNSGLLFEVPEGYRFIGENDRSELRGAFTRAYMEGLAGDERLAYATSLALLAGNLVKRGVEQAELKPSDQLWLKTEQILGDHHSKFSKALAHHGVVIESMRAKLQAGFVKLNALLLAALIAGIAALTAALQFNKHLSKQGVAGLKSQLQGLRAQFDQLAQATAAASKASQYEASGPTRLSTRASAEAVAESINAPVPVAATAESFTLAELAARVASASDADEDRSSQSQAAENSGLSHENSDRLTENAAVTGIDAIKEVDPEARSDSTIVATGSDTAPEASTSEAVRADAGETVTASLIDPSDSSQNAAVEVQAVEVQSVEVNAVDATTADATTVDPTAVKSDETGGLESEAKTADASPVADGSQASTITPQAATVTPQDNTKS